MLTASHCTAYNYTEDVGVAGLSSEVWVSFDVTATANDFRCFLVESGEHSMPNTLPGSTHAT